MSSKRNRTSACAAAANGGSALETDARGRVLIGPPIILSRLDVELFHPMVLNGTQSQ
jgi:hypothetical protein